MKFFISLVAATLGLFVLYQSCWSRITNPPPDLVWVQTMEEIKRKAALETPSPKIVIIGGSEAHYGLSAGILSERTGLPAVNLATHAALTWRTHIRNALPLIRPGDVVIFSLNYNLLVSDEPNFISTEYWRHTEPWAFLDFPVDEWPAYMGGDIVTTLIKQPLENRILDNAAKRGGAITVRGDEVRNTLEQPRTQAERRQLRQIGNTALYHGETETLETLAAFQRSVEARGACFYGVYPGQLGKGRYSNSNYYVRSFERMDKAVRDAGIDTLNTPQQAFLPMRMMFDSLYHPTKEGRARITGQVVEALAERLPSSECEIETTKSEETSS